MKFQLLGILVAVDVVVVVVVVTVAAGVVVVMIIPVVVRLATGVVVLGAYIEISESDIHEIRFAFLLLLEWQL